jgi:hypothetical protein
MDKKKERDKYLMFKFKSQFKQQAARSEASSAID